VRLISESAYGFSIVEIVRENPKKKTIHFGGIKGQAIRECYMEMTYDDTMYEDSNIKSLPPFMDISITPFNTPLRI
jgi:fatty acid synthase subunit beta